LPKNVRSFTALLFSVGAVVIPPVRPLIYKLPFSRAVRVAFPDGNSALMLVCARLRHLAGTQWGCKKYMNMKHLETMEQEPQVG